MPIETIEDLRQHLRCALEVEHSTIPPYLCALYSLEDQRSPAAATLRSVVMEEMLHALLVANVANAVGGRPRFDAPGFIPAYPCPLPHHRPEPPLILNLGPCTPDALATFLRIEQPEAPGAPPEDDDYDSLGQFYKALEQGLRKLAGTLGEQRLFSGDPSRQLASGYWGGGGRLVSVTSLATALEALEEIIEQGEGSPQHELDDDGELAHYWRLKAVADDPRALGKVYPTVRDPHTGKLPEGPLRDLSQLFDDCYALLLAKLSEVVDGKPYRVLTAVALMKDVLRPLARLLVTLPLDPRSPERGNAGPSFAAGTADRAGALAATKRLQTTWPQLAAVADTLAKLDAYDHG